MWFPLLGLVFIFIDNGFLHLKYNRITSPRKWEIISVISLLLIVMSMVFTEDITKGVVILSLMLVVGYILTSPLLFQDPFFHEDSKRARNRLRKQKKQKEFSEKETRP